MSLSQRVAELLDQGGEVSKYSASDKLGCDQRSAQRTLKFLHEIEKSVRISRWMRSYGAPVPVFTKADGKPDTAKPPPMTAAERSAIQRREHGERLRAVKRWKRDILRIQKNPPRYGFWGI